MKTTVLCLLMSAVFASCQSAGSLDSAKENIWKKNTSEGLNPTASRADATNAPLDGGLSVLLIAGAAFGAKRMYKPKKV